MHKTEIANLFIFDTLVVTKIATNSTVTHFFFCFSLFHVQGPVEHPVPQRIVGRVAFVSCNAVELRGVIDY